VRGGVGAGAVDDRLQSPFHDAGRELGLVFLLKPRHLLQRRALELVEGLVQVTIPRDDAPIVGAIVTRSGASARSLSGGRSRGATARGPSDRSRIVSRLFATAVHVPLERNRGDGDARQVRLPQERDQVVVAPREPDDVQDLVEEEVQLGGGDSGQERDLANPIPMERGGEIVLPRAAGVDRRAVAQHLRGGDLEAEGAPAFDQVRQLAGQILAEADHGRIVDVVELAGLERANEVGEPCLDVGQRRGSSLGGLFASHGRERRRIPCHRPVGPRSRTSCMASEHRLPRQPT